MRMHRTAHRRGGRVKCVRVRIVLDREGGGDGLRARETVVAGNDVGPRTGRTCLRAPPTRHCHRPTTHRQTRTPPPPTPPHNRHRGNWRELRRDECAQLSPVPPGKVERSVNGPRRGGRW